MASWVRTIVYALLLILVVVYMSYYYRYPNSITILQTTLDNFYFDMLREKQPIVIEDRVVDAQALSAMWFKHNFTYAFPLQTSKEDDPVWIRNKYKFTLIHCEQPCEILVARAVDVPVQNQMPENATLVAIRLSPKQSVIVPYRMHYAITHKEITTVQCVGVHDLITCVLP